MTAAVASSADRLFMLPSRTADLQAPLRLTIVTQGSGKEQPATTSLNDGKKTALLASLQSAQAPVELNTSAANQLDAFIHKVNALPKQWAIIRKVPDAKAKAIIEMIQA